MVALLQKEFPDAADATLTWRIFDLKSRGLLYHAGRGQYTTDTAKKEFCPVLGSGSLRYYGRAADAVGSGAICCFTDTAWVMDVAEQTIKPTFIVIEAEKSALPSIYDVLSELSRKVFLNPDAADVHTYVSTHDRAIVLRPLVSEAPTISVNGVVVSSLEKILVDAVAVAELYAGLQPNLTTLFQKARDHYALNESRLRRYARRRDRLDEVEPYLLVGKTAKNQNTE